MFYTIILAVFLIHLLFTYTQIIKAQARRKRGRTEYQWTSWLIDAARLVITGSASIELYYSGRHINLSLTATAFGLLLLTYLGKRRVIAEIDFLWSRDIEVRQGHQLVVSGPYSLVRHPHYALNILELATIAMIANAYLTATMAIPLVFVVYGVRIRAEERVLMRAFGCDYDAYRKLVGCIFPIVPYYFNQRQGVESGGR